MTGIKSGSRWRWRFQKRYEQKNPLFHRCVTGKPRDRMSRQMFLKNITKDHWLLPSLIIFCRDGGQISTNAKVATLGLCLVPSTICKKDDWQTHVTNLASLYQDDLRYLLLFHCKLSCTVGNTNGLNFTLKLMTCQTALLKP